MLMISSQNWNTISELRSRIKISQQPYQNDFVRIYIFISTAIWIHRCDLLQSTRSLLLMKTNVFNKILRSDDPRRIEIWILFLSFIRINSKVLFHKLIRKIWIFKFCKYIYSLANQIKCRSSILYVHDIRIFRNFLVNKSIHFYQDGGVWLSPRFVLLRNSIALSHCFYRYALSNYIRLMYTSHLSVRSQQICFVRIPDFDAILHSLNFHSYILHTSKVFSVQNSIHMRICT